MLNAYEQRLMAFYLANAASALHHRDREASDLADWIADRENRVAFGPLDKWWQARVSGDASDGKRPTRNMASSQAEANHQGNGVMEAPARSWAQPNRLVSCLQVQILMEPRPRRW